MLTERTLHDSINVYIAQHFTTLSQTRHVAAASQTLHLLHRISYISAIAIHTAELCSTYTNFHQYNCLAIVKSNVQSRTHVTAETPSLYTKSPSSFSKAALYKTKNAPNTDALSYDQHPKTPQKYSPIFLSLFFN